MDIDEDKRFNLDDVSQCETEPLGIGMP